MYIKICAFFVFAFFVYAKSNAQVTIPVTTPTTTEKIKIGFGPTKNVVKLDPLTRLPIGNIPFDRTFILRVYFDKNADLDVVSFYLHDPKDGNEIQKLDFYLIRSVTNPTEYDKSDDILVSYPNSIDIIMPPLSPNRYYEIKYATGLTQEAINHYLKVFKLFYDNKIDEGKNLQTAYKIASNNDGGVPTQGYIYKYYVDNKLNQIYDQYAGDTSQANKDVTQYMTKNNKLNINDGETINNFFIPNNSYSSLSKVSTYVYTVQSSSKLRIVADGGVIYTGWQQGFNSFTTYTGINISLRPMDTDIPFRALIKNDRIKFYERFTFNIGITLNSLAKDNYRANLFGNNNVMLGTGFKISHAINLNFGGLLYYNIDSNPLIANKTLGIAPYAGISINLLIRDALGDIAKIFTYGK